MLGRYYSAEEDTAIFALRALNWSGVKIAAALNRSAVSLEAHLRRLKQRGSPNAFKQYYPAEARERVDAFPIAGETWTELPARSLSISSHGRVRTIGSDYLRKPHRQSANGALAVNAGARGSHTTVAVDALMREAYGERHTVRCRSASTRARTSWPISNAFSAAEDEIIRKARSMKAAKDLLPTRNLRSVQNRAYRLGVRFSRWEPAPEGSGPKGKADLEAAKAAVPKWIRPENREDLINDIVMMQLEGFEGDANEAFKIARARHGRLFNEFRDMSFDNPIAGTDGLTIGDRIASDRPHF